MAYLSAMQRALLLNVSKGVLYAFRHTETSRVHAVGHGTDDAGPKIKALGVRLAITAGHVELGEERGKGQGGAWYQLRLTRAGRDALEAAEAAKRAAKRQSGRR